MFERERQREGERERGETERETERGGRHTHTCTHTYVHTHTHTNTNTDLESGGIFSLKDEINWVDPQHAASTVRALLHIGGVVLQHARQLWLQDQLGRIHGRLSFF